MLTMKPKDTSMYPEGTYLIDLKTPLIIDGNGCYPELRDEVLREMQQVSAEESTVDAGDGNRQHSRFYRSSMDCQVSTEIYNKVRERLDFVLKWQLNHYKVDAEFQLCERIQFLKYTEEMKGHFKMHTDNGYIDAHGSFQYPSPRRVISMVTYLNDDFEGGYLNFGNVFVGEQPYVYRPKAGESVIFGADIRYPHEVTPVTKGVRYSIVSWYDARPIQK